ncbi:bifunctional precorrin-2 dehydrogenase/sirohydrochlorin ferrochelatase [bacterium]|nr:bifunctional precorrin-2 dehydrogenase/sirohydrochlorin ferrochelatase [bacterium]
MFLPLFFKTQDIKCLIVGGGEVAAQKTKRLSNLDSEITLIAPEICDELEKIINQNNLTFHKRGFQNGDCRNFNLIIAATSDRKVNIEISKEARLLNIPVNVVDDPELCTVVFSANWHEDPLIVAVSTSGNAPFLASEIRNRISEFGKGFGNWVKTGGTLRKILLAGKMEQSKLRKILSIYSKTTPDCIIDVPKDEDLNSWTQWIKSLRKDT